MRGTGYRRVNSPSPILYSGEELLVIIYATRPRMFPLNCNIHKCIPRDNNERLKNRMSIITIFYRALGSTHAALGGGEIRRKRDPCHSHTYNFSSIHFCVRTICCQCTPL